MTSLPIDDDMAWLPWKSQWRLKDGTIYLNHGSFGPSPEPVRDARRQWIDRMDHQPMEFFVLTIEPALVEALGRLADFVGTSRDNLVFAENATFAMNVVADSFPLKSGDEVVLTNHEYGAVKRIWERRCKRAGIDAPQSAHIPLPIESEEQVLDAIFGVVTKNTRLIVVSHVTSATAIILPVDRICEKVRELGVAVCIDGPHAPAQVPLDIDHLDCDFYTASSHKWLSAPFGSGFLYVNPKHQKNIEPLNLSWGRLPPTEPTVWSDEFLWSGTRDPSPYLTIPAAIDFMEEVGLEAFRSRTHYLAQYACHRLHELTGMEPVVPDKTKWYGSMALAEIPDGEALPLQIALREKFGIETPIIDFADKRFIRVSCHLYNDKSDVDQLIDALHLLLMDGK